MRALLVSTWLVLGTVQTTTHNHAAAKPAVNQATTTQTTAGVANAPNSPKVVAKPLSPRDQTPPKDLKPANSKETAGPAQLPLTPVATKLSFEIARLGKMNVEGLSRRALTWTVILVVLIAVVAGFSGRAAGKASGGRVSTVTICVTAIVAGLTVFFLLRPRLAPLQDVETVVTSVRDSVQSTTAAVSRQNRRVHELENSLQAANDRLASLPPLQAALLTEKDRLQDREKQLDAMNADTQVLRNQLKASIATIDRQREELYVMRHNNTALWLGWSALVLAILATYHVFLLRRYRRVQYGDVEDMVEHYLRRRGVI